LPTAKRAVVFCPGYDLKLPSSTFFITVTPNLSPFLSPFLKRYRKDYPCGVKRYRKGYPSGVKGKASVAHSAQGEK
jgi:hypothetical protein